MTSAPKRIGIFGNFGIGNFGNAATLELMLQFLRHAQPEAELTCVCTNPEKVHRDHGIPALPFGWPGPPVIRKLGGWSYAISVVRKFDLLIIPGTGILNDFGSPPWALPYTLFRWCLAARLCGVTIALVSVGAGPLHHPLTRWFIRHVASMAQYRSYRNKYSVEFLQKLGVDTKNDHVYPDLVFRLSTPSPPLQESAIRRRTVCVGAMLYHGWSARIRTGDRIAGDNIYEHYLRKLTDFVLWLLERDYRVRILMGADSDQKAVDDLCNAVLAKKPSLPEAVLIAEPAHSGHEVMRQMSDADIVISSRFHSLVFAFMLGKLAISTGYAEYHDELMAEMGLDAFCQRSENIELKSLIAQFTELMSNKSYYEAIILNAVTCARKRLAHQDNVLASQFLNSAWHKSNDAVR